MYKVAPIEMTPIEMEIMTFLRQHSGLTRNDIADHLQLSRTKTTQHIDDLMQRRIVTDNHIGKSSGGRKPKIIDLDAAFCYVIGIYMGTTGATIGIADFKGELLHTHRIAFSREEMPIDILDSIIEAIYDLLGKHQIAKETVYALGIGVSAPVDKETGLIISPANLLNWDNFSVVDYFSRCFPNAVVQVDNDANVMALGEAHYGLGQGHDNFIYTKVGTGIGCGIVCNGEVYRGHNGVAGDIGHVSVDRNGPICYCGGVGCLERLAAAPAIIEQAIEAIQHEPDSRLAALYHQRGGTLDPKDISTAANEGDKIANEIIMQSGQTIGKVLAALVGFFNPSLVIIGGGISGIGPQFVTSIHRTILEYSQPLSTRTLEVRKSEIGRIAGVYGALHMGLNAIFTVGLNK